MNNQEQTANQKRIDEFIVVEKIANLLDNKFTIPFTNTKFGVDFLIGLIPTVGDWLSFGISSILLFAVMRRGVGLGMLMRMMGNITLDATVGSIPILGDLFDLKYKANRRNVALLKQYYADNPNPPSAKWGLGFIVFVFLLLLFCIVYLAFKLSALLWGFVKAYL
jgi:hypothetical protein